MTNMKPVLFILIFASAALTDTSPWQAKFNSYVKGLPTDVITLLKRVDGCDHFAGEEPYDEQRRIEILKALTKLKCARIDKDRDALLKKYKKQNQIVNKIENFQSTLN